MSRITALEQELAETRQAARETSQRDGVRIGMLEREIAELTRRAPPAPHRARPPSTPDAVKRTIAPVVELAQRGPAVSRPGLVVLVVFALVVLGAAIYIATG